MYFGPLKELKLTKLLLFNLAYLSLSTYKKVRQSVGDILNQVVGEFLRTALLIILPLLGVFTQAVEKKNPTSIEGVMACLLSKNIQGEISQNWEYILPVIKAYIKATEIKSNSIQNLLRDKKRAIIKIVRPWKCAVIY